MKKTFLFASVAAVIIGAASCTDKEKEAQMQSSIDSLQTEIRQRDNQVTEYFALVSDIESNIKEIKDREKMISINTEKNQAGSEDSKKQILADLKAINALMLENKTNLEALDKKLQNSNYQTGKFKKMATELEERVAFQATEIETLNTRLNELVAKNETLNTRVDSLFTTSTTQSGILAENEVTIQDMDAEMHTAYYTSGTSDELIAKHIINKEGGFIGIGKVELLNPQINKSDLTSADIRNLNSIPVNSKKVELVTNHPVDSYEIVLNEDEKQVDKLVILDPDKFWESSKLLVMVKK
jgi:peptidoglycan hydrolase CwlO-like protein